MARPDDETNDEAAQPLTGPAARGLAALGWLGQVVLLARTVLADLARLADWSGEERRLLGLRFARAGLDPALPVALLAVAASAVLVVHAHQLNVMHQPALYGPLLVTALVRELAPLTAGFVIIARSVPALAAELVLARSADVQAPGAVRTLAACAAAFALSGVCLAHLFIAAALLAVLVLGQVLVDGAPGLGDLLRMVADQLDLRDGLLLGLQTAVPGLLMALIAGREGLAAPAQAVEAPRAAARAGLRACLAVALWIAAVSLAAAW